ncbi:14336_t:CDS:2, partial [Funneliformis caledonium]
MINLSPRRLRRYHAIPGYEVQAPGIIKKEILYINFSFISDLERAGDRQDISETPVE